MNGAAERRTSGAEADTGAAFAAGIQVFHREAAGLIALYCLRPSEMFGLLMAAISGDRLATQILSAADKVVSVAPGEALLCGRCARKLSHGRGFTCIALPRHSDPTKALGFRICDACAADDGTLVASAKTVLRGLWPDVKQATQVAALNARGGTFRPARGSSA